MSSKVTSAKVAGWKVEKLGNLCEKITDGTHVTPTYVSEGVPFLSVKNLTKGFIDFSDTRYISREEHEILTKRVRPERGDILYTKVGTTGIAKVVDVDEEFSIFVSVALLKIKHNLIFNKYLEYFLNSPLAREQAQKRTRGMANKNLVINDIKEIEIHYPESLPEQERIVSLLDETFAALTKVRENAARNLLNAREVFEAELRRIFENENKTWEEKSLHEIGRTQTGTTPKTSEKKFYGNFIPFIKPADIDILGDGVIRYDNEGLSKLGLQNGRLITEGSILMVCIGASIGKIGFVDRDVSCNQQINSLSINKGYFSKFFYYAMRTNKFFNNVIKNSAQATLPIINKSKWENLKVSFPKSLEEQRAIVSRLDELSKETRRLEEIYQRKLDDVEELRKSVLKRVFQPPPPSAPPPNPKS